MFKPDFKILKLASFILTYYAICLNHKLNDEGLMSENFYEKNDGLIGKIDSEHFSHILGDLVQLWLLSKQHRHASIAGFENQCMPAIHLNQFRIYHQNDKPVAYVAWAFFNQEIADQYLQGNFEFKPEYWNCGNQLWFIDIIAPHGHVGQIRNEMRNKIFPNQVGYGRQVSPDRKTCRKRKFYGANVNNINRSDKIDFSTLL